MPNTQERRDGPSRRHATFIASKTANEATVGVANAHVVANTNNVKLTANILRVVIALSLHTSTGQQQLHWRVDPPESPSDAEWAEHQPYSISKVPFQQQP